MYHSFYILPFSLFLLIHPIFLCPLFRSLLYSLVVFITFHSLLLRLIFLLLLFLSLFPLHTYFLNHNPSSTRPLLVNLEFTVHAPLSVSTSPPITQSPLAVVSSPPCTSHAPRPTSSLPVTQSSPLIIMLGTSLHHSQSRIDHSSCCSPTTFVFLSQHSSLHTSSTFSHQPQLCKQVRLSEL